MMYDDFHDVLVFAPRKLAYVVAISASFSSDLRNFPRKKCIEYK